MTLQLWLTAAVAIVGNIAVIANGLLSARNATRLATRMRDIDRRDNHRKEYVDACRGFLAAARLLRAAGDRARAKDAETALAELRRAVAGIELYRPDLADGVLATALTACEELAELRTRGAPSGSISAAEARCGQAVSDARAAIAIDLPDVSAA
ncbi:hypothetical protein [Nocardia lasii]|uniref:Uncharacterized protein n=1 Tax=Nocardia lasii TaxID=1616107 RepID=A0ABW1JQ63_9NOCA